jgi:hypothetical protein
MGNQRQAATVLPSERYMIDTVQGAAWFQRPVWTGAKNLAPTGIQSPDRPARSRSLYRLSYRGPPLLHRHRHKLDSQTLASDNTEFQQKSSSFIKRKNSNYAPILRTFRKERNTIKAVTISIKRTRRHPWQCNIEYCRVSVLNNVNYPDNVPHERTAVHSLHVVTLLFAVIQKGPLCSDTWYLTQWMHQWRQ